MSDSAGHSKGKGSGFRGRGGKNFRWNWRGKRHPKNANDGSVETNSGANNPDGHVHGRRAGSSNSKEVGSKQMRMTDVFPTVPCPYQGWHHYFPTEEFTPTSVMFRKTSWFKEFLERRRDKLCLETIKDQRMFMVDHQELITEQILKDTWPQLKEDLIHNAIQTFSALSLAMHQILVENTETPTQEDSFYSQKRKLLKIPFVRARLTNFRPITPMKHLGAAFYGKLVAINATVVRVSNTKPLCLNLAFQCRKCSSVIMIPQTDGKYKPPGRCTAEKDNIPCTGTQFQPLRGSVRNTVVDWQTIRLQEKSSDGLEVGRIPRTVDCELVEDMVDACSPGEIAVVIGVVKVVSVSDPDRRTGTKDKNMYSFYIDAVAIHNQDRGTKAKADADDGIDASVSSSKGSLNLNLKDYEAIQKIHAEPNLFAFLVASLCPSIFGHEVVKAGLLLALLGGSNPKRGNDPVSDKSHFTRRCDIHILVVGDPGLGKSQMLQACTIAAPRGVYVCGSSTTNSGLTVTLTKDSQCNGNEYSLEAGALVLGDQGICCIDEFDKMHGQHQALLEAMEQQSISLAKAGVVCSLPARTSILAAANPVGGHYNKAKTVSENIKMGPALLSRFDLVFLLLDRPSAEVDTMLTNHIMALHGGKASGRLNPNMNTSINTTHQPDSLLGRLMLDTTIQPELLPIPLLRKYIAYAREYVHPQMNDDAKQEILKFYVQLRQTRFSGDSVTITHRQLESLVRMTQARARAELREFATADDARDVIEMVKTSFDDVFRNEAGILDFTRSQNGSGMSARSLCKKFIAAVQKVADSAYKNLFNIEELKEIGGQFGIEASRFHNMIETLNNQGLLLKKGPKTYQLQVVDY